MNSQIFGQALGPGSAVRRARQVTGPSLQAAMYVRPRGAFHRAQTHLIGGLIGYLLRRRIPTSTLPQVMLLALDTKYLYLFSVSLFQQPQEMGRWRQGTYAAAADSKGIARSLTLDVDGLGHLELEVGTAGAGRANLQVIDLVVGLSRRGSDLVG